MRLPLLRDVSWPDEQVAFHRAALGLVAGELLPAEPDPKRRREALLMAGDLGLLMAHAPEETGGPGHGLAASLLATEAFASSPAWSSIFEAAVGGGVDPLLALFQGGEAERSLLRSLGLGEVLAAGPRLHDQAFDAVLLEPDPQGKPSLIGGLPELGDSGADVLVVPVHQDTGERLVCFLHLSEEKASNRERPERPDLEEVPLSSSLIFPVCEDALLALALLRRLRSAFARVGSTTALLDRASRLLLESPPGFTRPLGGVRGRLTSAVARLDIARLLAHNAGSLIDQSLSSRPEDSGENLRSALIAERLLVDLSDLCSWYSLSAAATLIRESFEGCDDGSCRTLCCDAAALIALHSGERADESLDAARSLSSGSKGELPSLGLPGGARSIAFQESYLSASAQQTASVSLFLALSASPDALAASRRETLALPLLALGLELSAEVAPNPIDRPPSDLRPIREASERAHLCLETAKSSISKTACGPTLVATLSDLDRLWRRGPFRRKLADELSISLRDPLSIPPLAAAGLDEEFAGPLDLDADSSCRGLLSRAGEAGRLWPKESLAQRERAAWLAASLLSTEAFAHRAALQGILCPFGIQTIDPLLVLGENVPSVLREGISRGSLLVTRTPIFEGAFESVRARATGGGTYLLDGTLAEIALVATADLLLIPFASPSKERLVQLVPAGSPGVSHRSMGLDSTGVPIYAIELRGVEVSAASTMPVSEESLEAVLLLRSLRASFDLLGRARAIHETIEARIAAPQESSFGPGDLNERVLLLRSRLESARRIAHSAAAILGEEISSGAAGRLSRDLTLALGDRFTLVGLAKTSAWHACCQALVVDQEILAAPGSKATAGLPDFTTQHRSMARTGDKESFAVADDLPEELSTGMAAVEPPSRLLRETPAANAAHLCASLALEAASSADPSLIGGLKDELALLASAGAALDLWAACGVIAEPSESQSQKAGLGFLSVDDVLAAGRRVLEEVSRSRRR